MAYTRRRSGYTRGVRSASKSARSTRRPAGRSYASRRAPARRSYSRGGTRDIRLVIEQVSAQPTVTMEGMAAAGIPQVSTRATKSMF